jgi:tetratricopeptide (TPR) repeat protein
MPNIADMTTAERNTLDRMLSYLKKDPYNISLFCETLNLAVELDLKKIVKQLITHGKYIKCDSPAFLGSALYVLLKEGNYTDAILVGELALLKGDSDVNVRRNLVYAYSYTKKYADIVKVITMEPDLFSIPVDLKLIYARALYHLGKEQDAIGVLMAIHQIDPLNSELLGLLALLYDAVDNPQGLIYAKKALAIDPNQHDALLAAGDIYLDLQEEEQAEIFYQRLISVNPKSGRAWSGLAQIAFSNMRIEQAEQFARTSIHYMKNHIGTWHILAWCLIIQVNPELIEAREAVNQAYILDRNFAETHGTFAVLDALEMKNNQAEKYIRTALKLNPNCWSAHYAKIILLQQSGKKNQADDLVSITLNKLVPNSIYTGRDMVNQWLSKKLL